MLKKIIMVAMLATLLVGVVACGKKEDNKTVEKREETEKKPEEKSEEKPEEIKGTVVITGSTSVAKVVEDMKDEFEAKNPGVEIEYTGTGSSAGIKDAKAGTNNIGASSRELKDEEKEGLEEVTFAHEGIAVALHPSNKVDNLTKEEITKIYNGEITNWNEVGGEDKEIYVISREESSGTKSAFEELIALKDNGGITDKAATVEGNGGVQATVAGNENAISYVSFSYIDETIKAVNVDGVEATPENAKSKKYTLSRPFIFCYKTDNVTPAGEEFIEYALSDSGQSIVEKHGGIKAKG